MTQIETMSRLVVPPRSLPEKIIRNSSSKPIEETDDSVWGWDDSETDPAEAEEVPRSWDFHNGDPELFQYRDRLIPKNGGRVLDLGAGGLRVSAFFAMYGMEVTGVDTSPSSAEAITCLAEQHGLPVASVAQDMLEFCETTGEQYDVVILAQSLEHMASRKHALHMVRAAFGRVAHGGHLWVRADGNHGSHFDNLRRSPTAEMLDDGHTFMVDCNCSGTKKREPLVMFDPLDIHLALAREGADFVHSEVLPTNGRPNIMNGEDFNPGVKYERGGFITVLAQKPTV